MNSRRTDRHARLRSLTRAAYTAAAGHLEIDPEEAADRPERRWSVSVRAAVGAAVVVVLVGMALALRTWALAPADPVPLPAVVEGADRADATGGSAPPTVGAEGSASEPRDGQAPTPSSVVVHVAGAVAQPGVVEVEAGARVADAVTAAGGAAADAEMSAVNLARLLVDGEQVYVPRVGESPPGAAAGAPDGGAAAGPAGEGVAVGGAPAGGPVNLNTATLAELDTLPGVGPVLAQRIVDWRDQDGPFTSVEDLDAVSGIGPAMMERLRDLVTT